MSEEKIIASDGSELKPGMAVLGKNGDGPWCVSMFSHLGIFGRKDYYGSNGVPLEYCIPLEGNEHMAGTKLPIPKKEKPFEWGERVLVWDDLTEEKKPGIFLAYFAKGYPYIAIVEGTEDPNIFFHRERATI